MGLRSAVVERERRLFKRWPLIGGEEILRVPKGYDNGGDRHTIAGEEKKKESFSRRRGGLSAVK